DFNRDGDFLDAGEKSSPDVTVLANSGSANYLVTFSGFGAPVLGDSYVRRRLAFSSGEVASPTGAAASGEVEDFKITIVTPLAVVLADFGAAAQTDHILVTWETVSEIDNAGFNLYRSTSDAAPGEQLASVA
ncbi:MAG: hypothetical protein KDG58_18010, partial [Anaerolineae bacterium]|nr:hypothetical protein [Anaerolineae bacterium]